MTNKEIKDLKEKLRVVEKRHLEEVREVDMLEMKLESKEQVISLLMDLLKSFIFWDREK